MDGTILTALRTAAGSAAATQVLALPNASVLTVFGAGLQAHAHIEAICAIRPITTVYVINRTVERAEELVKEWKQRATREHAFAHIVFEVAKTAEEIAAAVRLSHIIVTATNSSTPLFDGMLLSPGCHVNAIGSYLPTMQEIDATVVKRALLFADDRESVS